MALTAQLSLPTASAARYVDALCDEFKQLEIEAVRAENGAEIVLRRGLGVARLAAMPDRLSIHAEADTEQGINILKFLLGMRLEKVAAAESPDVVWTGYGADFEVLPNFREITVVRNVEVTPHMRRVTFAGRDMARFCGREIHVRLLFPPLGVEPPEWPKPGRNGRPAWPPLERRPAARVYTIRSFDVARNEIDIDFVVHGDEGIAGPWAMKAGPGETIGILGPGGGEPDPAAWYFFGGDETAIPAIARHLQELPAEARGLVFIEVADAAEEQAMESPEGIEINWLHRNGVAAGRSNLLEDVVRSVAWPEDKANCLVWLGAEAAAARAVRAYLRNEVGFARDNTFVIAYWRHEDTPEEE